MIDIIRYSTDGFQPQIQSHHMKNVNYDLHEFDVTIFPEHMRYAIQQQHDKRVDFFLEHLDDLQEGCWFFINGYKDNQSLNHLKRKVPCWMATIDDDAQVYGVNWDKTMIVSDPEVKLFGCYIPKREMVKIHNISKLNERRV